MEIESVVSAAVSLQNSNLSSKIGVAMLDKSLDTVEENGDSLIKMMELSVNPSVGANVDIRL